MKKYILLAVIVLVAAVLRFWQLGTNPPSLNWDEVAWGYNAYSIGIDGKDEFGRFLPLDYLESYGDFKPPVYVYLDVLPVKVFGLTPFATRFPSALMGTLTVLVTFFLARRIFYQSKNKDLYAVLSSGILAISPWHIMLSRAAFEANVATFFIAVGVWLFLAGLQDKRWWLIGSIVSFVLSVYTFNSARVVSPLLVLFLTALNYKILLHRKKALFIACLIGFLVLIPTLRFLFTPQAKLRFDEVNIFSDPSVVTLTNQEILNDEKSSWAKLLHNRRLVYGVLFVQHYLDNLSPGFLFIHGDGNPKFSTQDVGQMYLWELPFFVVGVLLLFKHRESFWWLIPLWLFLGIIPAAVARETPHALRIEATLPTFQILSAYGLGRFLLSIHTRQWKQKVQIGMYGLVGLIVILQLTYYLHGYYTHYPKEYSSEWEYGYEESVHYVMPIRHRFKQILITDQLGRPYMYYLFYGRVNPNYYRSHARIRRDAVGFVHVDGFDNLVFTDSIPGVTLSGQNILYINLSQDVPAGVIPQRVFHLVNGNPVLESYQL